MLGSVPDAQQQSGSILSQFGFIRRGDVELALRRMGATIGIPPIYPTEIASHYRGKSTNRCGYSLPTEFFGKSCGARGRASHGANSDTRASQAACQFLAVVSQLAPEINTEPKSEDAKECAYNRDFDWGHRRHKKFSLSFDCTQRGPKWKSNSAKRCGIRGYLLPLIAPNIGESLFPFDRVERGHELFPSFVDPIELAPRSAHRKRDEEAAAQAGHLRMTAKPTDGLLVCLAAVRAAYLNLGIIKWAFGDDASLSKKPR